MNYDTMMKEEGNKEMKRQEAQAAEAGRNEVAGSLSAQRALGRIPAAREVERKPKRRMTR
ncbi:MAG: hypothetical protein EBR30_21990 [Cytophagia bacterium]|jgi:hypothetical protein|nr:hypothetical protein [Cytophagia bacterium]